ncbi:MAG: DUF2314 domain-containing protein [Fimbriimonas sp.]
MVERYLLQDVETWSQQNPETTAIPSREMRERLVRGDLVKLHFLVPSNRELAERMWVEVQELTDTGYIGRLDNDPLRYFVGVLLGNEIVAFEPKHVASIWIEPHHDWEKRMLGAAHSFTDLG